MGIESGLVELTWGVDEKMMAEETGEGGAYDGGRKVVVFFYLQGTCRDSLGH